MSDSEQCSNRLELDLISLLVNFSCELGQIMTTYYFLCGGKWGKVGKSSEKWGKVGKTGEDGEKWEKVWKSDEKMRKVTKSDQKFEKVGGNGKKC